MKKYFNAFLCQRLEGLQTTVDWLLKIWLLFIPPSKLEARQLCCFHGCSSTFDRKLHQIYSVSNLQPPPLLGTLKLQCWIFEILKALLHQNKSIKVSSHIHTRTHILTVLYLLSFDNKYRTQSLYSVRRHFALLFLLFFSISWLELTFLKVDDK